MVSISGVEDVTLLQINLPCFFYCYDGEVPGSTTESDLSCLHMSDIVKFEFMSFQNNACGSDEF